MVSNSEPVGSNFIFLSQKETFCPSSNNFNSFHKLAQKTTSSNMRLTPYAQLAVALLAVVTARPAPGLLPRDIYDFSDEYSSDLADVGPSSLPSFFDASAGHRN